VMGTTRVDATTRARITYHDACAGLRELGIKRQPRALLGAVEGLELHELDDVEVCCGFGGTFCVKYPDVSTKMVSDKAAAIENTGAELVLAGDLGCLMNIAGRLKRQGSKVEARHVAEVLADEMDAPPIGASAGR
jgi:L-lactate dehydrogenase complex protein LldE